MYITETTDNVRNLISELEQKNDLNKIKFLIYIFGLLNNNQINDKNEANPDIIEDDIKIFSLELLGMPSNTNTIFLQYMSMLYNVMTNSKDAYEETGNVMGVEYNNDDKKLASTFEKLDFNEKLDVFSEIIIRYDNETYFTNEITMISFDPNSNGFDLAKKIQDFKE